MEKVCHQGEDPVPHAHNIERKLCLDLGLEAPRIRSPKKTRKKHEHLLQESALGSAYGGNTFNSHFSLLVFMCICVETGVER